MTAAETLQLKAENIAALNLYLLQMPPVFRKRTILALREKALLSDVGAELLIEYHGLEAL